ncbi:hypothetical protein HII31_11538 [Pseudocercospora fuligena]|uniref:Uncharacterized protein n=1 Tax=Pseudocercospora fuligena TaxID=685502 RepID=A0A8H6RAX5_9PEZI|nr:hypothetical protein HII31_11538 [Pseudocercospora fuligena]
MAASTNGEEDAIRYPSWLTEDAPQPPTNTRRIAPAERIDLLVSILEENDALLPIDVGRLFRLANDSIRSSGQAREFSFIEFKIVVRCMVLDETRAFGIFEDGKVEKRRDGMEVVEDEEEVVRIISDSMEGVYGDAPPA